MATYNNDLRLKEISTGDEDGSWGVSNNTNLSLVGDAFSAGTKQMAGDANETFTIPDGAADAARSLYLRITSAVSLTATRVVTLAPNTVSKVWIIENATTGAQSLEISQGSGANVTVPTGQKVMIYTDGAGAGAAVVNANPSGPSGPITATGLTMATARLLGRTTAGAGAVEEISVSNMKFTGGVLSAAPGSWVEVSRTVVSTAVATVDFTNIDSSADEWAVKFLGVAGASSQTLWMRTSANNGSSYDSTTVYDFSLLDINVVGFTATGHVEQGIPIGGWYTGVSTTDTRGLSGIIFLDRPSVSGGFQCIGESICYNGFPESLKVWGTNTNAAIVNAIRFYFGGNITSGTFILLKRIKP